MDARFSPQAIIKVIGVGGSGGNAVNTMIESGLTGVDFICANTDVQSLQSSLAPIKIQLGRELTKGLGAGANPEVGRDAAIEDKAIIQEVLAGAEMVFVTAGMGGGTGTGAAPVIAQIAREMGILTVGVVTKPFGFEGKRRRGNADQGISNLRSAVDTLITIPNQRLLSIAPPDMSMLDAFKFADEVLLNAVKGISDIINHPGRINVDFADVKTTMSEMGMAIMGIGKATGKNRAQDAARAAIHSPLLEDVAIEGATGVLINISGPSSMTLHEISEANSLIQEAVHEDANIIFGVMIDEAMGESIHITVIATGFDAPQTKVPEPRTQQSRSSATSHNVAAAPTREEFEELTKWTMSIAKESENRRVEQESKFRQPTHSMQSSQPMAPDSRRIQGAMHESRPTRQYANEDEPLDPVLLANELSGLGATDIDYDTPTYLRRRENENTEHTAKPIR